jgi:hypothetical protein
MKGQGSQTKTQRRGLWQTSLRSVRFVQHGYTVVEVMVFLAVSGGLFVLVAGSFSAHQAGTEFSSAGRDMESSLQDIANDVSTGYYSNPGNFRCRVDAGAPVIEAVAPTTDTQGTNNQCIFIGRVAQFDIDGTNGKQFNVYSVVGARQAGGEDVQDFDDAQPRSITNPPFAVDLTEPHQIPPGLVARSMYAQYGGTRQRIRAVGFFSSFGPTASADPTSLNVSVIPLGLPPASSTKAAITTAISNITTAYATNYANPSGGVVVCFDGDNINQHALLRLGGNNRQLATDLTIAEGTCDGAGYPV